MSSQKFEKPRFSLFRRKPESSQFKGFWTPAFAGVTALRIFYETVNLVTGKNNLSRGRVYPIISHSWG